MALKFSLYLPTGFTHEWAGIADPVRAYETVTDLARAADESGYEAVWVPDHLLPVPPSPDFMFECWTTLAALARDTSRVRVGQMVSGNNYRNPALQAKMASTLDVLSHGRFTFGIGAGWYEPDYAAYGYEYLDGPDRLRQLAEALQIILSMWTKPETTFEGEYYQVRGALNEPKGVQTPHVPILVAGGGEKVTLKLVAQYGDACNVLDSLEGITRKYAILKRHCESVGREYESIHRTSTSYCVIADTDEEARAAIPAWAPALFPGDLASYGLIGTPDTIRERIAAYEAAGVQELLVAFGDATNPDMVRRFAREFIG
jgi:F420-dependent oxidoreductase-like protein